MSERVHPEVLSLLQESGMSLSSAKPGRFTEERAKKSQLLITTARSPLRRYTRVSRPRQASSAVAP